MGSMVDVVIDELNATLPSWQNVPVKDRPDLAKNLIGAFPDKEGIGTGREADGEHRQAVSSACQNKTRNASHDNDGKYYV